MISGEPLPGAGEGERPVRPWLEDKLPFGRLLVRGGGSYLDAKCCAGVWPGVGAITLTDGGVVGP